MISNNSIVMKFGGTSVEDTRAFARAAKIVGAQQESRPVVVVSAISRMTDALSASTQRAACGEPDEALSSLDQHFARHLEVAQESLATDAVTAFVSTVDCVRAEIRSWLHSIAERQAATAAMTDAVLAYGEQLSSTLLAAVLRAHGIVAQAVDARRCLVTNDEYGCASPLMKETAERTLAELGPAIDASVVPVLGGFIGATIAGATTTLGRGGSDYSAAIVGAALSAREIQIWTDVSGVLTANPRVVANAQTIPRLSYAEAAELAYFGAKVLHPKTIQPAVESGIAVRICNSRAPQEPGTLVCADTETTPHTVKAIAHKTGVTTVQVSSARMLGSYGFLRKLFEVFDQHRTVVDVVTTSEVSVSLSLDDDTALPAIVAELLELGSVQVEEGKAIICVVGAGLRGTPGIAARVFSTISDINVTLISQGASSINLTFAVAEDRVGEAVARLHREFFEAEKESNVQGRTMDDRRWTVAT